MSERNFNRSEEEYQYTLTKEFQTYIVETISQIKALTAKYDEVNRSMERRFDKFDKHLEQIMVDNGSQAMKIALLERRIEDLERKEAKEDASEEKKGDKHFTITGIVLTAVLSVIGTVAGAYIIAKVVVIPAPISPAPTELKRQQ